MHFKAKFKDTKNLDILIAMKVKGKPSVNGLLTFINLMSSGVSVNKE